MYAEVYDHVLETQGPRGPVMHCIMCDDTVEPAMLKARQDRIDPCGGRAHCTVMSARS